MPGPLNPLIKKVAFLMKFNKTMLYIGFVQKSQENDPTKTLVDALNVCFQVSLKNVIPIYRMGQKGAPK